MKAENNEHVRLNFLETECKKLFGNDIPIDQDLLKTLGSVLRDDKVFGMNSISFSEQKSISQEDVIRFEDAINFSCKAMFCMKFAKIAYDEETSSEDKTTSVQKLTIDTFSYVTDSTANIALKDDSLEFAKQCIDADQKPNKQAFLEKIVKMLNEFCVSIRINKPPKDISQEQALSKSMLKLLSNIAQSLSEDKKDFATVLSESFQDLVHPPKLSFLDKLNAKKHDGHESKGHGGH